MGAGKVAFLGPSGNDFMTGRKTKKDTRSLKAQISQQECEWRVDVVQFISVHILKFHYIQFQKYKQGRYS